MLSLLIPIQNTFAQKKGTKQSDTSALSYSYQYNETWRGLKFTESMTFFERSYFSVGIGLSEIWGASDLIDGTTYGINSTIAFGRWLAPIHGLEASVSIGMIPYASWVQNGEEQGSYNPYLSQYWSFGITYMLHLTSYAYRLEESKRWELIGLLGVDLKQFKKFSIETNVGMRLKYNVSSSIGLFVEPSISIFKSNLEDDNNHNISLKVSPTISAGFAVRMNTVYHYNQQQKLDATIAAIADSTGKAKKIPPSLNLKTNILYWMAFAPNISVEYRFLNYWSIGISASALWWKNEATHKYYQIGIFELESRRYLGKKNNHHVGIYMQGGMYDLEISAVGKLGEYIGVGVGYGCILPISSHLALDFEVGFGYTYTTYEEYQYVESEDIYEHLRTRRSHLFAPSRIGVSLIWSIPLFKKKGGPE